MIILLFYISLLFEKTKIKIFIFKGINYYQFQGASQSLLAAQSLKIRSKALRWSLPKLPTTLDLVLNNFILNFTKSYITSNTVSASVLVYITGMNVSIKCL